MDLLEILFEALELNLENYAMWIKYAFELGCAPIKIVNNRSIKFYLKLKSNEPDMTKFPLCVDIMREPNEHDRSRNVFGSEKIRERI